MDYSEHKNPMHEHIALFDVMAAQFNQIFESAKQEPMVHRLNDLRLAATVWDNTLASFVATDKDKVLRQVAELAAQVQKVFYKGSLRMWLVQDPDEAALYRKQYHDMCMILFRHAKQLRKQTRPLPLCLFTPGTVIEYEIEHVTKGGPKIATIASISEPDMGYGVVTTVETSVERGWGVFNQLPFPVSRPATFNTGHVIRVIKHVPGKLKHTDAHETAIGNYVKHDAVSECKPRGSYLTYRGAVFHVLAALERVSSPRDPHQKVDNDMLRRQVFDSCPGLKIIGDPDNFCGQYIQVSKKKLRRFVRQNMNRHLISRSEQEAREREYYRQVNADFDADLDHGYFIRTTS